MTKTIRKHRLLLLSILVSITILVIFLWFQHQGQKLLALDVKWILLSGVPILLGLFIGGYIKNFKGFGLELESNLNKPLSLTITSKITATITKGKEKSSLSELYDLSENEKNLIDQLRFILGKKNYYDSYITEQYLTVLKRIKLIEIVDETGQFLYTINALKLMEDNIPQREKINNFILAVESGNFEEYYHDAVSNFVLSTDTIIEAYRKIKKSSQAKNLYPNKEVLPVLNEQKIMVGVVDIQKLETKIVEEVEKSID